MKINANGLVFFICIATLVNCIAIAVLFSDITRMVAIVEHHDKEIRVMAYVVNLLCNSTPNCQTI